MLKGSTEQTSFDFQYLSVILRQAAQFVKSFSFYEVRHDLLLQAAAEEVDVLSS